MKYLLLISILFICGRQLSAQAVYDSYVSTQDGLIYKVNLATCTADSFTTVRFEIYDIALSPSGKLYIIDEMGKFYVLNINTMALQQIGAGTNPGSISNSLVCDSIGNLITIAGTQSGNALFYIDTLTTAATLIGPISAGAAGDLSFYLGDIYYDDESDYLHRVTLNPMHDNIVGPLACSTGGSWGLSTNIIDTIFCQPSLFAYSERSICMVNAVNGSAIPLCPDILPPNVGTISGAASAYGLGCKGANQAFAMPNAFTPNGDGLNDKFSPVLINGLKVTEFRIYNRWGQLVHNAPQPWDGTLNGIAQPVGTYLYYVVFSVDNGANQQKEIKQQGAVSLLR